MLMQETKSGKNSKIRQHTILSDFYQKLSTKAKISQLNFVPKHPFASLQPASPSKNVELDLTKMQKSLYNTKSVLLPALKSKKKTGQDQFRQKLIINETIFIHERVPVRNGNNTTIHSHSKWKPKKKHSTPLPEVNITGDFLEKDRSHSKLAKAAKSLKIVDNNKELVEISTTEFIRMDSQISPQKTLNRNKSSDRISKELIYYPVSDYPEQIKLPQFSSMDIIPEPLSPKKSHIEKMIIQYRMKRQKPEQKPQKSISLRCIADETIQQLKQINIKGEQTMYVSKPQRQSPKKVYTLTKDRSFEQLAKIRYASWKSRQFPFQELSKGEVQKLFGFYQGIKEAVPLSSGNYRVYVGDGNNGALIVRLLRNRGWWVPTDDINEAHLVWTQLPHEIMKKIQSNPIAILQSKSSVGFTIPDNALWQKQTKSLRTFLAIKNNSFFEGYAKLLHPIVYHKVMHELAERFKEGWSIKGYRQIRDVVARNVTKLPSLIFEAKNRVMVNHCEHSEQIGDKKHLLFHIVKYCQLNDIDQNLLIPRTIHIDIADLHPLNQHSIEAKLAPFSQEQSLYILKPGECTNRGNGISVHPSKSTLVEHLTSSLTSPSSGASRTFVVQEYIDPLLYDGRKFDIRVWVLLSGGKVWWYRQGYVRTSCKQYTTQSMSKYVHLTNDAVQKYADQYGKYEPGNKVSYAEMDKYLKKQYNYQGFYGETIGKMKNLTKILFEAGSLMIGRTAQQFEIFGLDFLVDRQFRVWLIECNTNPCLETSCSLLNRLVPNMLDNALTIAVDPHFPPPERKAGKEEAEWQEEKFNFELVSDVSLETEYMRRVGKDAEYVEYLRGVNEYKISEIVERGEQREEKQKQKHE